MPKPRKRGNEPAKKTLRIFCEGAKTEPLYIRGYLQDFFPSSRAGVVEIQSTRKNTPVQLVDEAISLKRSDRSLPGDEFWVVYDRESVAKITREKHAEAWQKASRAGVKIALSNVCFEFWLLLHVVDTSAAYSCCDDLLQNSAFKSEMRKRFNIDYGKASHEIYPSLKTFIPLARKRAKQMNEEGKRLAFGANMPFDINPFTEVCELLDAIDAFK